MSAYELRRGHALDLIEAVGPIDLLATDPPYALGGDGAEHARVADAAVAIENAGKLPAGWRQTLSGGVLVLGGESADVHVELRWVGDEAAVAAIAATTEVAT